MTVANICDKALDKTPKLDMSKVIKQYFVQAMPECDIARYHSVSRQAVNLALKPYKSLIKNPEKLAAYRQNRALIFDGLEAHLTELSLDKAKGKKATLGNVAYALDKVYQINRLEKGLSTQNIAVLDLTPKEREQLAELEAIENTGNPQHSDRDSIRDDTQAIEIIESDNV